MQEVIDVYERHARNFDQDRNRSLRKKVWLDQFLRHMPPAGAVLDLGCGMAEPIAKYLIEGGYRVLGADSSVSMIEMCRARFPNGEWLVADMREVKLGRRFDGILAWDSFFHLKMDDQRKRFARFAEHALPAASLMFTSGPAAGEATGRYRGEPLYHSSLDPSEYRELLMSNGFSVRAHRADDPDCDGHTVWLATYKASSPE